MIRRPRRLLDPQAIAEDQGSRIPPVSPEPSVAPSFRQASIEDAPAILALLEAAFVEGWPDFDITVPALDHLLWKMQPPGIETNHTVGEIDGQIIALELRWMGPALLDGRELITNDGVDSAVHPDFQGRGYSRIINDAPSRLPQPGDMGIDTPSRNPRLVNSTYVGDRNLTDRVVNTWARSLDARTALGTAWRTGGWRRLIARLPVGARTLLPSFGATPGLDARYTVREIDSFDDRADVLWGAASGQFDVARIRRAAYLNWRYDPRSGRSLILGAFEGDTLAGYVVFRPSGDSAVLADLLTHPDHPVATALARTGADRMRSLGIRQITAWLAAGHPDEPALARAGFLNLDLPVTVQFDEPPGRTGQTGLDIERFDDPALRMHITAGDFDFV